MLPFDKRRGWQRTLNKHSFQKIPMELVLLQNLCHRLPIYPIKRQCQTRWWHFYTSVNTCAIPGIPFHVSETPISEATSRVTTHFDTVREHLAPPFHAVGCTVLAFLTAASSQLLVNPSSRAVNTHISPVDSDYVYPVYICHLFSVIADHIAFTPLAHVAVGYATTTTGSNSTRPCKSSTSICQSRALHTYTAYILPC